MLAINLIDKFSKVDGYWKPKIVAEMNGQYVKIAKFKGEFIWHSHAAEDVFFQVVKGQIQIHLRDDIVDLLEGECFVVPKGAEHMPVAHEEAWVMMLEPVSTQQTGEYLTEATVTIEQQEWI
jgi:mannose-6-phosphate isomerase-like protein (cupin superfamily)